MTDDLMTKRPSHDLEPAINSLFRRDSAVQPESPRLSRDEMQQYILQRVEFESLIAQERPGFTDGRHGNLAPES